MDGLGGWLIATAGAIALVLYVVAALLKHWISVRHAVPGEVRRFRYFAPQYVRFETPERAGLRVRSGGLTLPAALAALLIGWFTAIVSQFPQAFAALLPSAIGKRVVNMAASGNKDGWVTTVLLGAFYLVWGLLLLRRWGRAAWLEVERDGRLVVRRRGLIGGSEDIYDASDYSGLYLEKKTLRLLLEPSPNRTTVCLLEDEEQDLDDVIETARAMRRITGGRGAEPPA